MKFKPWRISSRVRKSFSPEAGVDRCSIRLGLVIFMASFGISCRRSASELNYAEGSVDSGVVLGRIVARSFGDDITKTCYVGFDDMTGKRVSYLSLDESGWVITTLPVGQVKLSQVVCRVSGFWEGSQLGGFESNELSFTVAGGTTVSYFGELAVHFYIPPGNVVAEALEPSMPSSAAPVSQHFPATGLSSQGSMDVAQREFRSRYPNESRRLTVVPAILAGPKSARVDQGGVELR